MMGGDRVTTSTPRLSPPPPNENLKVIHPNHNSIATASPVTSTYVGAVTIPTMMMMINDDTTDDCDFGVGHHQDDADSISGMIPEKVKERDIDSLLAQELNQMTLQERERTYEEIHGVEQITEESPERIQRKLLEMEAAIQRIPAANKAAYFMALQKDRGYIYDPKFRLMFLRGTSFDVEGAAKKLVDFLQGKLELFGPQTLTRSVYLSDLDPDDMACLKSGAYQILPSRDSTGRVAIADFHLIVEKCYRHPINLIRTLAYIQLAISEDEETQKLGIVGIVYYVGTFNGQFNHKLNKQVAALSKWFPLRITGYHICFDDPRLRAWKPLAMLLMGKNLRVRVRFHDGTHTEVRYSLMTFGVPVAHLPINYQGELKTLNHSKWIARRKFKENQLQSLGNFEGIDLPTRRDVILRRGRVFHDHPGNQRMRQLIDSVQCEYANAPVKEKPQIAMQVVNSIRSEGGRFLERDKADGWWLVVDDKEACKRVGKAIRTMRQTTKRDEETEPSEETLASTVFLQTDDRELKRPRLSQGKNDCFASIPCFNPFSS